MAESKKNRLSLCFTRFGTAGKKVHVGRESADLLKDSPFRAVRRYFSGTTGTKVRKGRVRHEKVKKLQAGTRKPELADVGECVP
ncbi:hypothetical protein KI387_038801, partial [Taxus chinensis]